LVKLPELAVFPGRDGDAEVTGLLIKCACYGAAGIAKGAGAFAEAADSLRAARNIEVERPAAVEFAWVLEALFDGHRHAIGPRGLDGATADNLEAMQSAEGSIQSDGLRNPRGLRFHVRHGFAFGFGGGI
jgi:hypothetical protein